MAAVNGAIYTKAYLTVPANREDNVINLGGKVHLLNDSFTGGAGADVISFGKLPKGAIILSIISSGMGTSPSYSVAPFDVLAAETVVEATVGSTPGGVQKIAILYAIA